MIGRLIDWLSDFWCVRNSYALFFFVPIFRKQKITEKLNAEQSETRVQTIKLPKVNAALARKFLDPALQDDKARRKARLIQSNPTEDDRFKALFSNPEFQIDDTSEEYRLLNPLVSKMDRQQRKRTEAAVDDDIGDGEADSAFNGDEDGALDADAALASVRAEADGVRTGKRADDSEESSDDDREWIAERRKQERMIKGEKMLTKRRQKTAPVVTGRGQVSRWKVLCRQHQSE